MTTSTRPQGLEGKPALVFSVSSVQVLPPSPERKRPLPLGAAGPSPPETELRVQDSPVPTQTLRGLEGSIAIAPIDCTACLSKTGLKRVPPSSDFQTPPEAAPMKIVVLPPSLRAATAAMRPLIA